jgi:ADP-ribosylglycohydrolase
VELTLHAARLARARRSLDGLSVGDGFGERFFLHQAVAESLIAARAEPRSPWRTTDDTAMALSIVETLEAHGQIEQDDLARRFAERYAREPWRGYGGTAHEILKAIGAGSPWRAAAGGAFGGAGSMGNGAAMRAAPIGAYFAEDLARVVDAARASAEVTHAHPDGIAGAIAVALAAAFAASVSAAGGAAPEHRSALFHQVLARTPPGPTRDGVARAAELPAETTVEAAAFALGSGHRVLSMDTVPFALWCAARHLSDFVAAMWTTVAGLGDRDTTCAIAGGIVALSAPELPQAWLAAREPLAGLGPATEI